MIFRENSGKNFTNISNSLLQNQNISFRARGIAAYLLSKSEDWETSLADLKNNSPKEGRDSVRTAMRELQEEGFATLNKIRDVDSGELKGERWFVSDNKDWVRKISGRPSVFVARENGKYKIVEIDPEADTPHWITRTPVNPTPGKPDAGESNTTKEKKEKRKEYKKEKIKETSSSKTQRDRPYLSESSHEWRAVAWWKRILEENEKVPDSVTRTGGITQKTLEQWAETLNKLHRIDGWTYDEIGQILKWLVDTANLTNEYGKPEHGNFWFTNSKFWSLNKLRKKTRDGEKTIFDAMYDAMIAYKSKPKKNHDNFTRG